jgi:putative acyl-CoA dehydrogenase
VLNQPPPLVDYNAFDADVALREALIREGGKWGLGRGLAFGDLPLGVDGASIVERSLAL